MLSPFTSDDIRQLAQWALPRYAPDQLDRLARRLVVDTAGLPLLVVELLHAVSLGYDLDGARGGAAWPEPTNTLDQTLPGDLPDPIVASIRVGYRRLTAEAQLVLAAASVLGDRVPATKLHRATQLADGPFGAAVDETELQRWLVVEGRGYSFVARIVRDIVARDMVRPGRRQRFLEAAGGT